MITKEDSRIQDCAHGGKYSVSHHHLVKYDFSSSLNPLGLSKIALKEIKKNLKVISTIYPDPESKELRKDLIKYHRLKSDIDNISIGNGATELIHNFVKIHHPKKILIPIPTFCEYELAGWRNNSNMKFIERDNNFMVDPDRIIRESKGYNILFLCNPNNPDGGYIPQKNLLETLERLDKSTILFLDECFIDFVGCNENISLIKIVNELDNLVILRSLTKSHALAGLRIGYLLSNKKIIKEINNNQITWNVNGIAQIAASASIKDLQYLKKSKKLINKERKYIINKINSKIESLNALETFANYFLIKLNNRISSTKIKTKLLNKKGVLIRDCSTFRGMNNDYIRVSIKTHSENMILFDSLNTVK